MPHPVFTRQRVVIVGKTHMKNGICVGGIVVADGRPVRLLPVGQAWHQTNTPFQIGEIWDMDLAPRVPAVPPHVEDHDEQNAVRVGTVPNLSTYIIGQKTRPVIGAPSGLFSGRIAFRVSGTAYVDTQQPLPSNSVGFWILPHPLAYDPFNNKPRYRLGGPNPFLVTYVGVTPAIPTIPAGTLVRLSLARPWTNADDPAEHTRCSVQLSGWY
jgi:hypothetical protein